MSPGRGGVTPGRLSGDGGGGGGGAPGTVVVRLPSDDEESTVTRTTLDTDPLHHVDISADSGWDTDLEAEGKHMSSIVLHLPTF